MSSSRNHVRVVRSSERRSPEQVRRLGRALIALARAQLEAEAQAQGADHRRRAKPAAAKPEGRRPRPQSGDAA